MRTLTRVLAAVLIVLVIAGAALSLPAIHPAAVLAAGAAAEPVDINSASEGHW